MIGFGGHRAKRRASGAAGRPGTSRRDERPCRVRQMVAIGVIVVVMVAV
jgi:hypothetical protein